MGFWDAYWKSLKPLEVEEPIDVWVHRPIAYLLARAALPTSVSPNLITLGSIALGIAAGAFMIQGFAGHVVFAGVALFFSAVFDCADGQLARLRGTSSPLGRMLDGCADLIVSTVVVTGSTYLVFRKYSDPTWHGVVAVALCAATIVTGSFHTSLYDHYKNLFLKLTHPTYRESEDYEIALARYEKLGSGDTWWVRLAWPTYMFYLRSQINVVKSFDPYTVTRLSSLPEYDARFAAIYRKHAGPSMRLWRTFFGFGSLVFGISVTVALGVVDYYMLLRLLALNGLFYGYMRPAQRAASRAAFEEMALARGGDTLSPG